MLLINKGNENPYIIAILSADKAKFKCYIDVNKFLVSVSICYVVTFTEATEIKKNLADFQL